MPVTQLPARRPGGGVSPPAQQPESRAARRAPALVLRPGKRAPHLGEVYAHKEYILVGGETQTDLAGKVNVMLNHNWELQGGVAVEHLPSADGYGDKDAFFYQAMVRGV